MLTTATTLQGFAATVTTAIDNTPSGDKRASIIATLIGPADTNVTASMKFYTTIAGVIGQRMEISSAGDVWIGASAGEVSAKLDVQSTTQGFLPPRLTTTQRDAISTPAAGLMIYNTTTNKHQGYDGTVWNDFY
jgi:hypothetical protein